MEHFLRQNIGKQAEVVFSVGGESITVTGMITEVTEDEVLLKDNDVLTAGNPDDVLLVRITAPFAPAMAQAEVPAEAAETKSERAPLPQTQNATTSPSKGRIISPSLRASC